MVRIIVATIILVGAVAPAGHLDAARTVSDSTTFEAQSEAVTSEMAAEFGRTVGISSQEAELAFAESGSIADFNLAYRGDDRFGAIWVTYDGGYRVHVRVTGDSYKSMAREIEQLDTKLKSNVEIQVGGASAAQLWGFAEEVHKGNLLVRYELDDPAGQVVLYPGTDFQAVPKSFPKEFLTSSAEPLPEATPATGLAGSDMKYSPNWSALCTAGFMWGGYGVTGFATAGHCPDPSSSTPASLDSPWDTFITFSEVCAPSGGDYQAHSFVSAIDPKEHVMNKSGSPWSPIPIEGVAGGYFVGQQVYKTGRWANSTSSSWGVVSSFGTITNGAGGDCPGGSFSGLKTTALAKPGDSGGPMLLLYSNLWYGAAMTSSTNSSGYANGQWLGWINPAALGWGPSAHWCTKAAPCGAYD